MKSSTEAVPEPSPARQPAHASRAPSMTHEFDSLRPDLAYLSPDEISQIEQAYEFSRSAHEGQFRKSGEPYISHPLAVAGILAGWHLDAQTLCAALLHDVVEDTPATASEIEARFGKAVA
ncbi:MAG TPA: HD domain-containing protein, partial [Azonexus sp.]|nr:HD domain-containing protein [Azonexus sp.]